ncbi:protein kinase [Candidatus Sumerlaeota bacterium]|nr:protein kinase [Candidatus Sumerlaeota bacterium]
MEKRFTKESIFLLCFQILLEFGLFAIELPEKPAFLWHDKIPLYMPNDPLIIDLDGDDLLEIVCSDVKGQLMVFDAETGKTTWKIELEDKGALSPPVAADFTGKGSLDIVAGSNNGNLYLVDGARGEIISKNSPGNKITLSPSIIPLKSTGEGAKAGVVICNDKGDVALYEFVEAAPSASKKTQDAYIAKQLWTLSVGARITAPVSVGSVTDIDSYNAVVGTSRGDLWILDRDDPNRRIRFANYDNRAIETIPGLAQIQGDEKREIVYGDIQGNMNVLSYSQGEFKRLWAKDQPLYERPIQTMILHDTNQDGADDIMAFTKTYIFAFNGATGESLWTKDRLTISHNVNADPALIYSRETGPLVMYGNDRNECCFIDPTQKDPALQYLFLDSPFEKPLTAFNAGENQESHLLCVSEKTALCRALKIAVPIPSLSISWECRGGNQFRTCRIDPAYDSLRKSQMRRIKSLIESYRNQAKTSLSEKNWMQAHEASGLLLAIQPGNKPAKWIHAYSYIRLNLAILLILTISGATFIVFLSIKIIRIITMLRLISRAQDHLQRNELEDAAACYRRVLAKNPGNRGVTRALAGILIKLGDYGKENIPIFEKTYEMEPENKETIKALACAYTYSHVLEDKALKIYEKSYELFEDPSPIDVLIGRIYFMKEDLERAGKHIRNALRGGLTDIEVYNCLADIYMAQNYRTHKALPIFKKVYEVRKDDQKFLEAFCDAYIDAKITDDPRVKSLCQKTLSGNPGYLPAYIHLAKIHIQEMNGEEAAKCARRILEIDPQNHEGLLLLSQYYIMEKRKDKEALDVYLRAIEHFPEDKELLRIISHIYFEKRCFDDHAIALYRRSFELNPQDVPTLLALAYLAKTTQNHDLSIESIEKLIDLGQFTNELLMQLASAYRIRHYTEPRSEKVYQSVLKTNPDDSEFLLLYAEACQKQGKTDASLTPYYEKALKIKPDWDEMGRHLLRTYIQNRKYNAASSLARHYLSKYPEDEEIQHLCALADLQGNRWDEAIAEYKAILAKKPDDAEALVNMALAYSQKKLTTDTAYTLYERALKEEPENEILHRILGATLIMRGRINEGLKEYDTAIRISPRALDGVIEDSLSILSENPGCTPLRWFLCERMIDVYRIREAMEQLQILFEDDPSQIMQILPYYTKILEKDPQNALAHMRYGVMRKILGYLDEARQSMEHAYQLMPSELEIQKELGELYEMILEQGENIEIRFHLGKLYLLFGEYDNAISCFQKTSQDFRWEAESVKYLGKCFVEKGMPDLALQEFKKLTIDEELKEILYDLAQRYEANNDLVGAKQVYKQLFAADINFRNVKAKFELLSGSTSDPMVFEKTTIINSLSEKAKRRYELLEELGRGAMGIVYRARDNELEETVALKILPDNLSNNPEALHRFKSEARSARRLSHKNIVRIHDIGEELGRKYISMEFVDGTDLKRIFREKGGRIPLKNILNYMIVTARALDYAHSCGIVHRDIKPANIMVTKDDEVKISDFGIAKMLESADATIVGSVIGTPLYMSPEQVRGLPVDNRADIYSLGITLYELLNGKPPFYEGDLAYQHLNIEPRPIKGAPDELQEIIFKCLKKNPAERWQTAEEFADALNIYRSSLP